ncbi:hypothetical protein QR680_005465 [Steinernema hermaphroditum]|uniref:Uncharacterized protein n=1 Tax=Steinernema hermaphroditum TaxID=289476 RepID=A0AA39HTE6_9BILA|nr:hypothetical protein QR680_005465 [Steinernema hermaphroditum]
MDGASLPLCFVESVVSILSAHALQIDDWNASLLRLDDLFWPLVARGYAPKLEEYVVYICTTKEHLKCVFFGPLSRRRDADVLTLAEISKVNRQSYRISQAYICSEELDAKQLVFESALDQGVRRFEEAPVVEFGRLLRFLALQLMGCHNSSLRLRSNENGLAQKLHKQIHFATLTMDYCGEHGERFLEGQISNSTQLRMITLKGPWTNAVARSLENYLCAGKALQASHYGVKLAFDQTFFKRLFATWQQHSQTFKNFGVHLKIDFEIDKLARIMEIKPRKHFTAKHPSDAATVSVTFNEVRKSVSLFFAVCMCGKQHRNNLCFVCSSVHYLCKP